MSKKAQKRLARAARVAEHRAVRKEQRREERREERGAAQLAKRQRWAEEDAAAQAAAQAAGADADAASTAASELLKEAARLAHERRLGQARERAARRAAATSDAATRVAVDLRWADGRMTPQELRSLSQQLSFAYAAAQRADPPLHLLLLGAGGALRAQMEGQLAGLGRWAATVVHDDGLGGAGRGASTAAEEAADGAEAADKGPCPPCPPPPPPAFEDDGGDAGAVPIAAFFARRGVAARDLIYLSADSPHELDDDANDDAREGAGAATAAAADAAVAAAADAAEPAPGTTQRRRPGGLDPSKVYVVGGVVDRNRHKGACLRRAEAAGMSHARLPIERHLSAQEGAVGGPEPADGAGGGGSGGGGGGGGDSGARRLAGSRVITVNQVVELLARRASGDTWAKALAVAIPPRKTAAAGPSAAAAGEGRGDDRGEDDDDAAAGPEESLKVWIDHVVTPF